MIRTTKEQESYDTISAPEPVYVDQTPRKVMIIMMPFATPEFPGLGPTLIRSILVSSGIPTDIKYGNLVFSKIVGADSFVEKALSELPICEIAFTPYYFNVEIAEAASNLRDYVLKLAVVPSAHSAERFLQIVKDAGVCVETLFQTIDWERYDVVGFSLLMGQTVASLALAKRIKQAHPHISIIVGGAHTQAPMGDEMLRSFPEFDYVLQGEADEIVAPFVEELRQGVRRNFKTRGILYRDEAGAVVSSGDSAPFTKLDSLPVPDFGEFFHQMEELNLTHIQPYMPLETSRGCWWGEKHHCTFCGIDDKIMVFRSKKPIRVIEEIVALSQQFKYTEFFAVDSIINFKFFNELLPTLGQLRQDEEWDLTCFFESKSNINRDQVRRFSYGGVNHIQPGLETFSDHILKLMDKGSTGVRQVQCLKLLAEFDILADWNLIYGNPEETPEDYQEIIDLIPFIHHIQPLHEGGLIPMQINRYAPYHNTPERYGIKNIRPKSYYNMIYPDPTVDLNRISFYFDCDFEISNGPALTDAHRQLEQQLETWRACYVEDALLQFWGPGFIRIVDRRSWDPDAPVLPGDERVYTFDGLTAEMFRYCCEIRTLRDVHSTFDGLTGADAVKDFIERMVSLRLIYLAPSGQLIGLPLLKEAEERFRFSADTLPRANERRSSPVALRSIRSFDVVDGDRTSDSATLAVQDTAHGYDFQRGDRRELVTVDAADHLSHHAMVEEILRRIEATRSLDIRLAGLHVATDTALLEELASRRSAERLGFRLVCDITAPPTRTHATLMREAGIKSCTLHPSFDAVEVSTVSANLRRIAALKSLSAADISLDWAIDERTLQLRDAEASLMAGIFAAVTHLPPPKHLDPAQMADATSADDRLVKALTLWPDLHSPRSLTYARGPGFMRIFDRRGRKGEWRFITLREDQGDILSLCDEISDIKTLREKRPNVSISELQRFLDALLDMRLLCQGPAGEYLSLPIRRTSEERWASGDY